MRPLALDDLPQHSAWARYLLDPTGEPPADPTAYTRAETYDEQYEHLLKAYRGDPVPRDTFALRVAAKGREDPGPISVREDLFLVSPGELLDRKRSAVRDALTALPTEPDTVFDLGCGWGAALGTIAEAFPDATVEGAEYSRNGVELARALYAGHDRVSVEAFDVQGAWDLVDGVDADGDAVVFSRGVATTLTGVEGVVDRFAALAAAGDVVGGVHLEQVDVHPATTLGLLRRRYARVRGYDGELLDALRRRDGVEVTAVSYDAIGPNPLHPLTVIRWRPA